LRDRAVVVKLFDELAAYKARAGGYLRILKFGFGRAMPRRWRCRARRPAGIRRRRRARADVIASLRDA